MVGLSKSTSTFRIPKIWSFIEPPTTSSLNCGNFGLFDETKIPSYGQELFCSCLTADWNDTGLVLQPSVNIISGHNWHLTVTVTVYIFCVTVWQLLSLIYIIPLSLMSSRCAPAFSLLLNSQVTSHFWVKQGPLHQHWCIYDSLSKIKTDHNACQDHPTLTKVATFELLVLVFG